MFFESVLCGDVGDLGVVEVIATLFDVPLLAEIAELCLPSAPMSAEMTTSPPKM